jgi:hypothetical protein
MAAIITLKEPVQVEGGKTAIAIHCDFVIADQMVPHGLVEYRIGKQAAYVPIHNILGITLKDNSNDTAS